MDENNNDTQVEEEQETPETELTEETDWKAEAIKARGIAQRLRTKLTKATEKKVEKPVEPVKKEQNPGELDTGAYAYLAAKGIEDDEDIAYIQKRMEKWDMSLRDVLKDEDVQAKLKEFKIEREVKAATPGTSKRTSSGVIDNVDYWIAKFERTGEYPTDFALKSAVVNAIAEKANPNKPPWR